MVVLQDRELDLVCRVRNWRLAAIGMGLLVLVLGGVATYGAMKTSTYVAVMRGGTSPIEFILKVDVRTQVFTIGARSTAIKWLHHGKLQCASEAREDVPGSDGRIRGGRAGREFSAQRAPND